MEIFKEKVCFYISGKRESKIVPVHTMKAHKWVEV
jgi:hypothetical protein